MFDQLFDAALLDSVIRAMIPILLAALGGMICERAGVFQIAMEGMMLAGAFAAVAGSYLAQFSGMGVLFAIVAGVSVSLMLAFGTVSRRGDPIVLGIALNLMALGLTGFLLPQIFGVRGVFRHARIDGLDRLPIPLLSDIPWIGPVLFNQTILAYVAFLLVPGIWIVIFPHPPGPAPERSRRKTSGSRVARGQPHRLQVRSGDRLRGSLRFGRRPARSRQRGAVRREHVEWTRMGCRGGGDAGPGPSRGGIRRQPAIRLCRRTRVPPAGQRTTGADNRCSSLRCDADRSDHGPQTLRPPPGPDHRLELIEHPFVLGDRDRHASAVSVDDVQGIGHGPIRFGPLYFSEPADRTWTEA